MTRWAEKKKLCSEWVWPNTPLRTHMKTTCSVQLHGITASPILYHPYEGHANRVLLQTRRWLKELDPHSRCGRVIQQYVPKLGKWFSVINKFKVTICVSIIGDHSKSPQNVTLDFGVSCVSWMGTNWYSPFKDLWSRQEIKPKNTHGNWIMGYFWFYFLYVIKKMLMISWINTK